MTVPFWKSLGDDRRERLFALMRELGDEADKYFARGREKPGTIPVGAALFDEVLQGAVRLELVTALRSAPNLEEAARIAADALRLWVTKHNERRSDINWQRWTESGQDDLRRLVLRIGVVIL